MNEANTQEKLPKKIFMNNLGEQLVDKSSLESLYNYDTLKSYRTKLGFFKDSLKDKSNFSENHICKHGLTQTRITNH